MQQQREDIVFNRMQEAMEWHRANRHRLLATPEMVSLLHRYDMAIDHTQEVMRGVGVAAGCSLCAAQTGSCCFQEVETWYDTMLLFINLLLGADLPGSRPIPDQCAFLGLKGCGLRARYSFCLNYFCPGLKTRLGPIPVQAAMAAVGEELAAGWQLEQSLYRWFNQQPREGNGHELYVVQDVFPETP